MAKKQLKFKPTPAGILFLSAIAILLIAIIVLIVWAAKSCGEKCKSGSDDSRNNPPIVVNTDDPDATADPNESPEPTAPQLAGGWQTPESTELTDDLRAVFTKAVASKDDATYEPVSLLGTQVVAGTNYCFLAKKTEKTPDAQPTEVKVYIYEDLAGNAEVTDVTDAANLSPEPSASPAQTTPGTITTNNPGTTPGDIIINTPGQSTGTASPGTTTPAPTMTIYTSPTKTMKNNAQKGYVSKDKVKMRKGPGTNYDVVKSDIAKNTAVTLYVEQNGWWFLKCGDKYGYIRKDLVTKGTAPTTPSPTKMPINDGEARGKVIASKIALRKEASESSECIKEYKTGEQLVVYYFIKDSSGRKWYFVKTSDGKKGYMFAEYVKITEGIVGAS